MYTYMRNVDDGSRVQIVSTTFKAGQQSMERLETLVKEAAVPPADLPYSTRSRHVSLYGLMFRTVMQARKLIYSSPIDSP